MADPKSGKRGVPTYCLGGGGDAAIYFSAHQISSMSTYMQELPHETLKTINTLSIDIQLIKSAVV